MNIASFVRQSIPLFVIAIFSLLFCNSGIALAFSPGGVSSGNQLWLTPTYGISYSTINTDQHLLDSWGDLSSEGNMLVKSGDSNRLTTLKDLLIL